MGVEDQKGRRKGRKRSKEEGIIKDEGKEERG